MTNLDFLGVKARRDALQSRDLVRHLVEPREQVGVRVVEVSRQRHRLLQRAQPVSAQSRHVRERLRWKIGVRGGGRRWPGAG